VTYPSDLVSIYCQGDDPFPLTSWFQLTHRLLKAASFDTFSLVVPHPSEIGKEVQLHLTRTRHGLSNEPSSRFYAAPNFLKMGIKYLHVSSVWTISTIQVEKSAAKFHYIVSSKVVAQSIAFRVVSICCQGDDPFTLKSWLQLTNPLLKAASFDTFSLVAPHP